MFKRTPLTAIAGMPATRFDQDQRRGKLPRLDGTGKRTYTMRDAFRLRCYWQAADATDLDSAKLLSDRALEALRPLDPFTWTDGVELHVALIRYDWPDALEGWDCRHVIAGRWEDLRALAKAHVASVDPSARLVSVIAFSATAIANHVWRAARELGLSETESVPGIPEDLTGFPEWFREAEVERRTLAATWSDASDEGRA
ncbi:hypothetical protein [Tabrizicola sp. YIM 78059]|uniref:hypothetical protein n=1 Tax=Tabrizicola sp. YIM 78059 TaxID=2529861 RepID=UPI0010AA9119|nr:hypothetical protein [Tabrizicola sp. YIM 78059]